MKLVKKNVAIYVDGPNFLRKEYNVDLSEIKKIGKKYGRIVIARVFVNQFAPQKLIEAIVNEGFECLTFLSEREEADIDVPLALDALEVALTKNIDVFVFCTRDTDFFSLIKKIKGYGKTVVIVGLENDIPSSLKNSADFLEFL
ncbi:MAG: NYN domain-containing protein [Candidatus Aenigmatarchaeota archaeon]